ncbi:hypothetical protein EJ05DRAFT_343804 [Pseudovirgaria hyperparasitica]|uniref:Uncharacterized protein n=1 Tax=Pseudovirgaria hyperparasitica TaxID=470096 RepID=A0A6A6W9X4_9PEZI|nr:uncharacterized protein EJ05DRAFT_343804 [Pseudovirgaria hyperparasitica]KAF2759365.1 hypothetical protein EJ05DRAFT_343804 [Pseudovirgaria hyperparasitica]
MENEYAEVLMDGITFASIPFSWWAVVMKTRFAVKWASSDMTFMQILVEEYNRSFRPVSRSFLCHFIGAGIVPTGVECLSWLWRGLFDSVLSTLGFKKHNVAGPLVLTSLIGDLFVNSLCAPMLYHSVLVQTGLLSSLLPSISAWKPGSALSPFPSFRSWQQILLSPIVVHNVVRYIGNTVLRSITRISEDDLALALVHPNEVGRTVAQKRRQQRAELRLTKNLPSLSRVLRFFGWGHQIPRRTVIFEASHQPSDSLLMSQSNIDVLHGQETADRSRDDWEDELHGLQGSGSNVPETLQNPPHEAALPSSARANVDTSTANTQPSVRITSRDNDRGYLELEIEIPAPHLEEETEHNRATDLSRGPSKLLAHFIHIFLERELLYLPSRIITTNFYALYFINTPIAGSTGPTAFHTLSFWLNLFRNLRLGVIVTAASNWALCTMIEYSFFAGLWGCHYGLTLWQGRHAFGWGNL